MSRRRTNDDVFKSISNQRKKIMFSCSQHCPFDGFVPWGARTSAWTAMTMFGSRTYIGESPEHLVYAPFHWETTLHCNVVSHWLGTYWSLMGELIGAKWRIYICHQTRPPIFLRRPCRLLNISPLSEPMQVYCHFGPCERISAKFESKDNNYHWRKWNRI